MKTQNKNILVAKISNNKTRLNFDDAEAVEEEKTETSGKNARTKKIETSFNDARLQDAATTLALLSQHSKIETLLNAKRVDGKDFPATWTRNGATRLCIPVQGSRDHNNNTKIAFELEDRQRVVVLHVCKVKGHNRIKVKVDDNWKKVTILRHINVSLLLYF